jgi:hypothetical protein
VSELEAGHAEQNSLEAEVMGGQGSNMGCTATGLDGWVRDPSIYLQNQTIGTPYSPVMPNKQRRKYDSQDLKEEE